LTAVGVSFLLLTLDVIFFFEGSLVTLDSTAGQQSTGLLLVDLDSTAGVSASGLLLVDFLFFFVILTSASGAYSTGVDVAA